MLKRILHELKHHASFTLLGAISGIVLMVLFSGVSRKTSYNMFYVFHPIHVFLSAMVTASIYKKHECKGVKDYCNLFMLLLIGYVGAIGVATLSDSLIPYFGECLLKMPNRHVHLGFIEKWWLINPVAILGVMAAYYKPYTKVPHSMHVLLSTWASLAHIMMAMNGRAGFVFYVTVSMFLFLAVWIPCCTSDIVFPLLFVKDKN